MKATVVCVTGGTGFIGRSLVVRLLAEGHQVRVLTRRSGKKLPAGVEVFRGDLGQPDCFLEDFLQGADLLFQCAAEMMNPGRCQVVNVEGVSRLIEVARGRVKR
jgi:nucleoside-diphosphate-sugar epimerase